MRIEESNISSAKRGKKCEVVKKKKGETSEGQEVPRTKWEGGKEKKDKNGERCEVSPPVVPSL